MYIILYQIQILNLNFINVIKINNQMDVFNYHWFFNLTRLRVLILRHSILFIYFFD